MRISTMFVAGLVCTLFTACGSETSAEVDSDLDGLSDTIESRLQTNPFEADTDHDGVFDAREHFFGMDPRRADSDGNGRGDGDEDIDGNGVCERQEHQFGPFRRGPHTGDAGAGRPEGARGSSRTDAGPWAERSGPAGDAGDRREAPAFAGERPSDHERGPSADAGAWGEPPVENTP